MTTDGYTLEDQLCSPGQTFSYLKKKSTKLTTHIVAINIVNAISDIIIIAPERVRTTRATIVFSRIDILS